MWGVLIGANSRFPLICLSHVCIFPIMVASADSFDNRIELLCLLYMFQDQRVSLLIFCLCVDYFVFLSH